MVFFGAFHLDGQQFLYATVLGALFSYIVYITGSIFSSMLFHFVINGSQMLLLKYQIDNLPDMPESTLAEAINGAVILTAITIPILCILFYLFIKHNKKAKNRMPLQMLKLRC